jgi:hypothetical protein
MIAIELSIVLILGKVSYPRYEIGFRGRDPK